MDTQLLAAGDLTLEYEPGKLRYLRLGDTELLRMMYFAVRDADWDTLPLSCNQEHLEIADGGFGLSFKAVSLENAEPIVVWNVTIRGNKDNRVSFSIAGTFVREYVSNRAGFCVLHPLAGVVGQSFVATSPQGMQKIGSFPRLIAPQQPATDIASLTWKTANGISCQLTFEGEVFEMEDQRNWTDASFKTYCTPLNSDWPKTYQPGDVVEQKVIFQVLSYGQRNTLESMSASSISYNVDDHFPWPGIGSRIPLSPLDRKNAPTIASLPLTLLRADLVWGGEKWQDELQLVLAYARSCQKSLHLVLHFVHGEIAALVDWLRALCPAKAITAISVVEKDRIAADSGLIEHAHRLLRVRFTEVKIGVGTQYLFTEFNRTRPHANHVSDFVFFGNNPQVHAFDNPSIIETIEGQSETLHSARELSPGLPIFISPIALNAPFSPDKLPKENSVRGMLGYDFDPDLRQGSLFMAGWLLGCLAILAQGEACHLDFFETEGERGLVIDDKITPSFVLLERIFKRNPTQVFYSKSNTSLKFSSLGISCEAGNYLYVANHTAEPLSLTAQDTWTQNIWVMTAKEFPGFSALETIPDNQVLTIPAYGIAEMKIEAKSGVYNG